MYIHDIFPFNQWRKHHPQKLPSTNWTTSLQTSCWSLHKRFCLKHTRTMNLPRGNYLQTLDGKHRLFFRQAKMYFSQPNFVMLGCWWVLFKIKIWKAIFLSERHRCTIWNTKFKQRAQAKSWSNHSFQVSVAGSIDKFAASRWLHHPSVKHAGQIRNLSSFKAGSCSWNQATKTNLKFSTNVIASNSSTFTIPCCGCDSCRFRVMMEEIQWALGEGCSLS